MVSKVATTDLELRGIDYTVAPDSAPRPHRGGTWQPMLLFEADMGLDCCDYAI
jgi:hypothetical protein